MRSFTTAVLCSLVLALTPLTAFSQQEGVVRASDAKKYEDQFVQVCGVIADTTYAKSIKGKPTYLNFTRPYPNHEFTVVIWGKDRKNFEYKPEMLVDHTACVYGKVDVFRGKAQMSIQIPDQISARKNSPEKETSDRESPTDAVEANVQKESSGSG